jgi:hypothetical protein
VLVVGLGDEREPLAGIERRVGDRFRPEGDAGDGDDADARILPADDLAGRRVAQVVPRAPPVALQPESETPGQNSERTAAATRSGDGM